MDKGQLEEFYELIDWLFERAPQNATAQVGVANKKKQAVGWYPGRKPSFLSIESAFSGCALAGATQLAFPSGTKVLPDGSIGWLSWVGMDIDDKDQVEDGWADFLPKIVPQPWSIRTSSSGKGIHLVARLEDPIECVMEHGTALIRTLAGRLPTILKDAGIVIDKIDRRMFWFSGGAQKWIRRTDRFLKTPEFLVEGYLDEVDPANKLKLRRPQIGAPAPTDMVGVSDRMKEWLVKLHSADLPSSLGTHQVYVGKVVPWLRAQNFPVKTVSRMRGNGTPNGYLEISRDRISLWSYADMHTIWEWSDIL